MNKTMKHSIYILITTFCIVCYACKNTSIKVERITLHPSSIILDSLFTQMPGALNTCGHYLVWEDPFNPDHFLRVVDINTKKEIGVMGSTGRGPKEFITPITTGSTGNKVFTCDLNQDKQAFYSIDSLLAGKEPFIPLSSYPIENCLTVIQTGENEFICTRTQNDNLFQWIHSDSTISFFGECPIKEEIDNKQEYFSALAGYLKYNPHNKKLIYSASQFPYIVLYEKRNSTFLLKKKKTSPKKTYKIENEEIHFLDEETKPIDIALTKDYIIALQQDEETKLPPKKRTAGIRDFSSVPNTIFVYDYDLNLKKIINMSMPILRIAASGDTNTLYAVGIDWDFCILTYEI